MAAVEVRNPRTGEVDYSFAPTNARALRAFAERMRSDQQTWDQRGVTGRAAVLLAWREALQRRREALVGALVADTGRLGESHLEVDAVLGSLARWAQAGPELLAESGGRTSATVPTVRVEQGLRPYPLVGVISPWNFPLLLATIDAIPALVAGCAVIVKPSEITPRFIEVVADSLTDVHDLAPVLRFVRGDGAAGAALIDEVDLVCFTGSVATGRAVAARAAERFIPAFLELGGKDPAIVLASADVDRASSAVLWGSTANAGQSCQSIERVYVEAPVHDEFVTALVEKAAAVTLAVPGPGDGMLGPIISADQVATIRDHLEDAVSRGAVVRCGGEFEVHGGGTYLRPTVLTDVDHDMAVMTEETFGPVIPVMAVASVDEAIRWANDTRYGLSAAVFAAEESEALSVARRLDAGGVSINDASLTALVHDGEKQSFRASGLGGSRMGPAALRRFGRRQAYLVNEATTPDPWWYPHLR